MCTTNINTLEMDRQVFWQINYLHCIENKNNSVIPKNKYHQKPVLASILIGNTGSPSVLCCIDLEMPEEDSKWAFVSDYKIGLLPHHDSLLMSKESQIRAHKEELNQRSSNLTLTYFLCIWRWPNVSYHS